MILSGFSSKQPTKEVKLFSEQLYLLIYRMQRKGLEVFLLNSKSNLKGQWGLPQGRLNNTLPKGQCSGWIALDPVSNQLVMENAMAVECDWHDLICLQQLLKEEQLMTRGKVSAVEQGKYFLLKEAFKQILPHQYAFLKELKEIITVRNLIRYI
ncbi:MAG: hypothetical protein AAF985_14515 [Bacteroidota bacterium]